MRRVRLKNWSAQPLGSSMTITGIDDETGVRRRVPSVAIIHTAEGVITARTLTGVVYELVLDQAEPVATPEAA